MNLYSVNIKIKNDDFNLPIIPKNDKILIINGKLRNIQMTIVLLVRFIDEYYRKKNTKKQYGIKIITHDSNISKLIGEKGAFIRQIVQLSGNSSIQINPDIPKFKKCNESIIYVYGSLNAKQDAICIILR